MQILLCEHKSDYSIKGNNWQLRFLSWWCSFRWFFFTANFTSSPSTYPFIAEKRGATLCLCYSAIMNGNLVSPEHGNSTISTKTCQLHSGQKKNYCISETLRLEHLRVKPREACHLSSTFVSQELMNEEQSPFLNTGLHSAIRQSVSALSQCFCLECNQLPLAV